MCVCVFAFVFITIISRILSLVCQVTVQYSFARTPVSFHQEVNVHFHYLSFATAPSTLSIKLASMQGGEYTFFNVTFSMPSYEKVESQNNKK